MPLSVILLGQRLREARKKVGLTQEELAERLKIDAAHLSKLERGAKNLTVLRLASICDALGIPIESILSAAYTPSNEEFNKQFGAVVKDCSPETIQIMLDVCEKIAEVEALSGKQIVK